MNITKVDERKITKWRNGETPVEIYNFDPDQFKDLRESFHSFRGRLAINEREEKLVYAYQFLRRFDIINFDGELIKTVEISPSTPLLPEKFDPENAVFSYMAIRASTDSFFLLYIGHSNKEAQEKNYQLTTYIEEFDWDGYPLRRYQLDNSFILDFDIIRT